MRKCPACKTEHKNPGYCSLCQKEYHKKWYQNNLQTEREKNKAYSKEYRLTHKEKCRTYQRVYQEKNFLSYKKYLLNWRRKNANKIKEYNKEYRKKNVEKQRIWRYAFVHFRDKMINEIGKCQLCGSKELLEMHHVEYNNNIDSIKLLCRKCHRSAHQNEQQL